MACVVGKTCPECKGKKKIGGDFCQRCNGTGKIADHKKGPGGYNPGPGKGGRPYTEGDLDFRCVHGCGHYGNNEGYGSPGSGPYPD